MRLLVLFACLAAASAAYYTTGHCYSNFTYARFCFFPNCFGYRVYYCPAWYTYKYYAPILKIYPNKEKCLEADWKEMTEDEFKSDCTRILSDRAQLIHREMNDRYNIWYSALVKAVYDAKASHERQVNAAYDELMKRIFDPATREEITKQKDEILSKYRTALYNKKYDAYNAYRKALDARWQSVLEFHQKILDSSLKCFRTRKEKIAAYEKELGDRMYGYLVKFKTRGLEFAAKQRDSFRQLLYKIHGSETWNKYYVDKVVASYYQKLYDDCIAKGSEYYSGLLSYKAKLIKFYRCSYQCATYSGCLAFNKRQYYSCTKTLGCWWSYKFTRTIRCYRWVQCKYTWRACERKGLKACDTTKVNLTKDEFRAKVKPQFDDAINAAHQEFYAWKDKWISIHQEYYRRYEKCIDERHAFLLDYKKAMLYCQYNCWSVNCQAILDDYKRELDAQKVKALREYATMLDKRINDGCDSYYTNLYKYKTSLYGLLDKIVARYERCLTIRAEKIAEYEKCQIAIRDKQRAALVKRLDAIVDKNAANYKKMLTFYGCGNLENVSYYLSYFYHYKMIDEKNVELKKFDDWWAQTLPKLVQHYACCYKCKSTVRVCTPKFTYNICWRVSYPTLSCYTFQYNLYCRYHTYKLYQYNGCYVYRAY